MCRSLQSNSPEIHWQCVTFNPRQSFDTLYQFSKGGQPATRPWCCDKKEGELTPESKQRTAITAASHLLIYAYKVTKQGNPMMSPISYKFSKLMSRIWWTCHTAPIAQSNLTKCVLVLQKSTSPHLRKQADSIAAAQFTIKLRSEGVKGSTMSKKV